MSFCELPKYVKRDLRRIYGKFARPIGIDIQTVLAGAEAALLRGEAVILDGWQWREVTGFGARKSLDVFTEHLGCGGDYRRKGDLIILYGKAS